MSNSEMRVRCAAATKAGNPCKNYAQPDSQFCHTHRDLGVETAVPTDSAEMDRRQQLVSELDELVAELKRSVPDRQLPEPLQPEKWLRFMKRNLDRVAPDVVKDIMASFEGSSKEDFLDPDTWKGVWYMLDYSLRFQAEQLKRRMQDEG